VLVVGPPSANFLLQLGSRYIPGTTDTGGKYLLTPIRFKLKPDDQRILTVLATQASTAGQQSVTSNNPASTSPGAGTTIATTGVLPAGTYSVNVNFNIAGTPAQGTDNNNITLHLNGAVYTILPNDIATGQQTFGPFLLTTNGVNAIQVVTNNAATAGAIYAAMVSATPEYGPSQAAAGDWMLHLSGHAITNRSYT
jgi:hypothetical protein